MQNDFIEQIKSVLGSYVKGFSSQSPSRACFELDYRGTRVEINFNSYTAVGSKFSGLVFELSTVCVWDFDLEIVPRGLITQMFDWVDGFSMFPKSRRSRIKTPLFPDGLTVLTNDEAMAAKFVPLLSVSKIIKDHGPTFFKIEERSIKIFLDQLSGEKWEVLRKNPALMIGYLDMLVDIKIALRSLAEQPRRAMNESKEGV